MPNLGKHSTGTGPIPGRTRSRSKVHKCGVCQPGIYAIDPIWCALHHGQTYPQRRPVESTNVKETLASSQHAPQHGNSPAQSRGRPNLHSPLAGAFQSEHHEPLRHNRPEYEARNTREGKAGHGKNIPGLEQESRPYAMAGIALMVETLCAVIAHALSSEAGELHIIEFSP